MNTQEAWVWIVGLLCAALVVCVRTERGIERKKLNNEGALRGYDHEEAMADKGYEYGIVATSEHGCADCICREREMGWKRTEGKERGEENGQ